jgi:hypothetical protein
MDLLSSIDQSAPEAAEVSPAVTGAEAEVCGPLIPALAPLQATRDWPAEVAERDLQASLQLLADRMQYLTGASAATIALGDGQEPLCRASAGPMAGEAGSPLRAESSLVKQSISEQQIVCCNHAEGGVLADGTSYGSLGIKAMMVMPLLRESEPVGMLELLADRSEAFDDRDGATLERLSEIVLTALEHADATKHALHEIATAIPACEVAIPSVGALSEKPAVMQAESTKAPAQVIACESCGFPISEGRKLCLDCEEARTAEEGTATAPAFLAQLANEGKRGWLQSHFYTIGTFLMVLLTVVVLMLKLR